MSYSSIFAAVFFASLVFIEIFSRFKSGDSMWSWFHADKKYWTRHHLLPSLFIAGTLSSGQWFILEKCPPYRSPIACQFDISEMPNSLKRQLSNAEHKIKAYYQRARFLSKKIKKISLDCKQMDQQNKCKTFQKEIRDQFKKMKSAERSLRYALDQLYIKLEHEEFISDTLTTDLDQQLNDINRKISIFDQEQEETKKINLDLQLIEGL